MTYIMPRKKAEAATAEITAPAAIACPACKSKISADGKTLHEKSAYLDELIETDTSVDEVEKKIEKMQKTIAAHEATIADLRAQLEAANKKPPQEKGEPKNVVSEKRTVGTKQKPASWWD